MYYNGEAKIPRKMAMITIGAWVAIGLAACGGDDKAAGGNVTPTPTPQPTPSAKIRVEGTSKTVAADATGKVVVMVPRVPNNRYADVHNDPTVGLLKTLPATALTEAAPGAYTGVKDDAGGVQLVSGLVTDLAGDGQYAIGRWTDGTDSSGGMYSLHQGRTWAVGTPWPVTESWAAAFPAHTRFDCQLDAATQPIAVDGNSAPGRIDTAKAHIFAYQAANGAQKMVTNLKFRYSIGQDTKQLRHILALEGFGYSSSLAQRYSVTTTLVGKDKDAPDLLVSYTFDAPTAGTISGMAAFSCKRAVHGAAAASDPEPAAADTPQAGK